MNFREEIIDRLNKISGKYSMYEVFSDWIRCCAIAISNSTELIRGNVWQDREKAYRDTMNRYTENEQQLFYEMFGLLTMALEEDTEDVLGKIYMESGMGSKATGQFFTPYHLSKLCAAVAVHELDRDGKYIINEPSCGGGGMIIAAINELKKKGINYQKDVKVVAQDLDWKGVYMCYLQLSLMGVRAVCVQGDTLERTYQKGYPPDRVMYTPAERGMLV